MNSRTRLAVMLALVGIVLAGFVAVADAQQQPPAQCDNPQYDINGDGKLDRQDLNEWKLLFKRTECRLGSDAADCSPKLDVDGNGTIERADLDELIQTYLICVRPVWVYPDR